ncbi:MAG: radical SAM protein [Candidatus Eremiobacteraeota bacterium]|nr:radical SAM protein [Candidatus Eremiobacteraeota bacterium]
MKTLFKFLTKIIKAGMGFHSLFQVNYAVTYRCPTRCRICNIWKQSRKDELTLDEIKNIAGKLKNIQWLRLTGGEPFLRQDFIDIVKVLSQAMPDLYLVSTPTGGFSPEHIQSEIHKILSFIRCKYVVTISLDGPAKIHDYLRNSNGSFDKALETYGRLKDLEKQNRNFRVFFGYTIQPGNISYFEKTIKEAKEQFPELNINDFHFNLAHKSEIYYYNIDLDFGDNFSNKALSDIQVILDHRKFSLSPYLLIENIYLRLAGKYLSTGKSPVPCNVYNISCFIDPFGDVYPCTTFNRHLGNLRDFDYDLRRIITSTTAKKSAREIKNGKCPQCWTPCEAHQVIVSKFITSLSRLI